MGILEAAIPAVIICTRDRDRATSFYRDILGLALDHEDAFAGVFRSGGTTLRVSTVEDFTAHGHTMLGFRVADVAGAVRALTDKGVAFKRFERFAQDDLGIVTLAGGAVQVAWFEDPDGNVLSVTNV